MTTSSPELGITPPAHEDGSLQLPVAGLLTAIAWPGDGAGWMIGRLSAERAGGEAAPADNGMRSMGDAGERTDSVARDWTGAAATRTITLTSHIRRGLRM